MYVQTTMLEWTLPHIYNKKPVHPPSKHRQWGIYTTSLLWTLALLTSVPKTTNLVWNAENRRGQPTIVVADMISRGQHFSIRYSFERVNLCLGCTWPLCFWSSCVYLCQRLNKKILVRCLKLECLFYIWKFIYMAATASHSSINWYKIRFKV